MSPPTSRLSCWPTTAVCRPSAAIAFALGVGAVLGVVNGFLVAVAKVPSIIATLGTLSIYRSLLTDHAGGKTDLDRLAAGVDRRPSSQHPLPLGRYEVRTMFALALVIAVVLHLVLQYVRAGRHLYAARLEPGGRSPGRA